jgi:hypothetical protein
MPKFFRKPSLKKIILRQEGSKNDSRYLSAELKNNGDLVFEGQDIGNGVKAIFGMSEYEWYWTVKATDIETLQNALGSQGPILELLKQNFSNEKAADLYAFLNNNNIPFESWSRMGD